MNTKILVIIVSYNFKNWMDRCLGSLQRSDVKVDVVVIDNYSTDNTVQLLKANYPEVRLICSDKNLGFGRANNIGLRIALDENYDAAFLLNQDAWVEEKTIGTLYRLCKENPQYGVISPIHLTGAGDKMDHGFSIYAGINSLEALDRNKQLVAVPFINAAFWMVSTDVLRKIGGFSPLFYHYGEDKDYVNRLIFHGYLVGYSPLVFGWHDRENRTGTLNEGFRSEFVYLLTELANINYSLKEGMRHSIKLSLKKARVSFKKGKWNDFKQWLFITFKLGSRIKKILKCRKLNKRIAPNYIVD